MMEQSQANLEVFAATLLELARQDSDLLVVTSDSRGSAKLAPFAKAAPGQPVVRLAELAVEQADQYIKTGKTDKPEKQTIGQAQLEDATEIADWLSLRARNDAQLDYLELLGDLGNHQS
jgi:hypothetical protein